MKSLLFALLFLSSCASYIGASKYDTKLNLQYNPTLYEDGRSLADLYIPQEDGQYPGVIVVHGGGWQSRSKEDMDLVSKSLASHGFVVMNINYRLAPKYKHPAPVDDLEIAHQYFLDHAQELKLDPKKIALWGYSSGGHTVSLYALTRSRKVQAVVSGGAPYDLTWYTHSPYVKAYTGFYRDDAFQTYIDASPVNHLSKATPPFFLYHALNDNLVEHSQTTSFESKLIINKTPVERYDIGFWGHGFAFAFSSKAIEMGVNYLEKKLK